MTKENAAYGADEQAYRKRGKRGHGADKHVVGFEKQLPENQGRGQGVNVEIVILNRSAHECGSSGTLGLFLYSSITNG